VRNADSLTGRASDRHRVPVVQLRGFSQPESAYVAVPIRIGVPDTTTFFSIDFRTQLASEGQYKFVLRAKDTYGVRDSVVFTYDVDRTAPPKPQLTPRPGPVSKESPITVVAVTDSTAVDILRTGGSAPPESLTVHRSGDGFQAEFKVTLAPGANHLAFRARDLTHNVSLPETTTVVFETSQGMSAPERFAASNTIQLHAGGTLANGAEVRIYATDGTLVRHLESSAPLLVYSFEWDLRTNKGELVKNGAYLVVGVVHEAGGGDSRYRKLIAVLE
jgi:hypothetical protein